jgi:hypothetical protein
MADDLQSRAADLVKKVLTVGVGAIFLTEESVRALVSEFKLPKELLSGVLKSANETKREFLTNLSQDIMSRLTDKIDPTALFKEFLTENELEFHVRLSIKPKGKGHGKSHGEGQ